MLSKKRVWVPLLVAVLFVIFLLFSGRLETQQFNGENFVGNEDELAGKMAALIKQVSQQRHKSGTVMRFNQAKSLGCFDALFTVQNDIPQGLKHGLFATPGEYPALIRFANASSHDDGKKDLRGMSVRVSEIDRQVMWGRPGTQDFLLNSYPALFAASPEAFLGFIEATLEDRVIRHFLKPANWKSLYIIWRARDRHHSPFDIRYWSTTPFQLGPDQAVKYSVRSCAGYSSGKPKEHGQHYLRGAMHQHLQNSEGCFDFMVQVQTNNSDMPIEDPSVIWDEGDSPFVPVARITFSQQEFLTKEALAQCETLTFNPWQSLEAHKPLGRMNYVRKQIYSDLATYRQRVNQARQ